MPASVLLLALFVSSVSFIFLHPQKDGRVFFFPDNSGRFTGSERRGIPHRHKKAEGISVFLDELILGPETLAFSYALPRDTVVRNVAVIGKTAYIDLSREALDVDGELAVSFDSALDILRKNIFFNFPGIEELVFTIEGQQVHSPPYKGIESAD